MKKQKKNGAAPPIAVFFSVLFLFSSFLLFCIFASGCHSTGATVEATSGGKEEGTIIAEASHPTAAAAPLRAKRSTAAVASSGGSRAGGEYVKCPHCDFWGYAQPDGSLVQHTGPVRNTRGDQIETSAQRVVHRRVAEEKLRYKGTVRTVDKKCDVQHEMASY